MLSKFFVSQKEKPEILSFLPPALPAPEASNGIEKAFARLFSTEDGRRVLAHLQGMALMRAYGNDATDAQLRHAEGQRALVINVMRLIAAGRNI